MKVPKCIVCKTLEIIKEYELILCKMKASNIFTLEEKLLRSK